MTPEEERKVIEAANLVLLEDGVGGRIGCVAFLIVVALVLALWLGSHP